MTKTLWTLNIGDYAPKICELTYPYLAAYAAKIGAEFRIIDDRYWPEFPPNYEKLQLFYLGKGSDWNIYVDSDALIHPDMYDITDHLPMDTVAHNGYDMAGVRWRYDDYFRRDGRHIGSANWFTVASRWCLDLWHPMEDLTLEEARQRIQPRHKELATGLISADHLLDDYVVSRNIARYGLKVTTVSEINQRLGFVAENGKPSGFLWHRHLVPEDQKLEELQKAVRSWG